MPSSVTPTWSASPGRSLRTKWGDALIGVVEELTGRKVLTYQAQVSFDPNIALEIFIFDDTDAKGAEATARGQLGEEQAGAATDQDATDAPPKTPK
jgi:hypothetical protein